MRLTDVSEDEVVTDPFALGGGSLAARAVCHIPLSDAHHETAGRSMTIRLADTQGERSSARMLINKAYSSRGYGDNHEIRASDYHATFTASCETGLIGTLTLAVDSELGLAADNTFHDEIEPYRQAPGAKICELTRFAFESNISSKAMLASLFHVVFIYGSNKYRCTDLFIEVSRRHARFYESMLGFKRVGALKINESVNTAAQLMHLKVSDIRDRIEECAGEDPAACRSLYPYFFSAKEERGIYRRLVEAFGRDTSPRFRAGAISGLDPRYGRAMRRSTAVPPLLPAAMPMGAAPTL